VEEDVERTTPEAIDLQATFRRMLEAGDTAVAMEVSSHALELGRVAGTRYAVKLFTNLTQDHLDFHHTMEAYFAAKRRLFDEPGIAVVNVDDEHGRRIASEVDALTSESTPRPTTARATSSSTSRARASCSTVPTGRSRWSRRSPACSTS
jgi:UDP-N-acetylmuramoyl-L-alanyl-D-glutamate--2,6-diaminopimelate ligase